MSSTKSHNPDRAAEKKEEVSQQAQKKYSTHWGSLLCSAKTTGAVLWDVHPTHPWIVVSKKDGSLAIIDHTQGDDITNFKLDGFFKYRKKQQASVAKKSRDEKKEKMGTLLSVKFFDADVITVKNSFKPKDIIPLNKPTPPSGQNDDPTASNPRVDQTARGSLSGEPGHIDCVDVPFKYIVILTDLLVMFYDYVNYLWSGFDISQISSNKPLTCMQFFPHNTNIAFGCSDGAIHLFDTPTMKLAPKIKAHSHSKPIERLFSFCGKADVPNAPAVDVVYLVCVSTDSVAVWDTTNEPKAIKEISLKTLAVEKISGIQFNYQTGEIYFLTEREVIGLDIQKWEVTTRINSDRAVKLAPFFHPGICGQSFVLLSLTQTTLIGIDPAKEQPIIDGVQFLTTHGTTLDNEPVKHIINFIVHPVMNSCIFLQTNVGISQVWVELAYISPSVVMTPSATIYTDATHINVVPTNEVDQGKRVSQPLLYRGSCRLLLSPSQEYMILHWIALWKFQIFRLSDMAVISEGDARGVEWCNFKDVFVVLFPFVDNDKVQEDKAREQAENDLKAIIEQKKSGDWEKINQRLAEKAAKRERKLKKKTIVPVPAVKYHTTPWISVRQIDAELGRTKSIANQLFDRLWPDQVFGGTVIGLTYTAKAVNMNSAVAPTPRGQSAPKQKKQKLIKFYTWNPCVEVMSPMICPISMHWDPTHNYCLFVYFNYFKIFQTQPWALVNTVHGVTIISATWHHQMLIYSTETEVICFFPGCVPFSFSARSFCPTFHNISLTSKTFFEGPTCLVGVQGTKISLYRGWDHHLTSMSLDNPAIKVYMLTHVGHASEALKWCSLVDDPLLLNSFFEFFVNKGYKKEALLLPVPTKTKLELCFKLKQTGSIIPLLKSQLDLLTQSKSLIERSELCKRAIYFASDIGHSQITVSLDIIKLCSIYEPKYNTNYVLSVLLNMKNPKIQLNKVLEEIQTQDPINFRLFRSLLPPPFDASLPDKLLALPDVPAEWNSLPMKMGRLPSAKIQLESKQDWFYQYTLFISQNRPKKKNCHYPTPDEIYFLLSANFRFKRTLAILGNNPK